MFRCDKMTCKIEFNQKADGYKIENTYNIISKKNKSLLILKTSAGSHQSPQFLCILALGFVTCANNRFSLQRKRRRRR